MIRLATCPLIVMGSSRLAIAAPRGGGIALGKTCTRVAYSRGYEAFPAQVLSWRPQDPPFRFSFLLGAIYELDMFGRVTKRLFENLNARFYESSGVHKFVSTIYAEIGEDASFRFLCAGQPLPIVFSQRYDRIMDTRPELCPSYPPLGMLPSRHVTDGHRTASELGFKDDYTINRWSLQGAGDILLLHTDGLLEQYDGDDCYYPGPLEQKLRSVKDRTAEEIFVALTTDLLTFSTPSDDISLVVIKAR